MFARLTSKNTTIKNRKIEMSIVQNNNYIISDVLLFPVMAKSLIVCSFIFLISNKLHLTVVMY